MHLRPAASSVLAAIATYRGASAGVMGGYARPTRGRKTRPRSSTKPLSRFALFRSLLAPAHCAKSAQGGHRGGLLHAKRISGARWRALRWVGLAFGLPPRYLVRGFAPADAGQQPRKGAIALAMKRGNSPEKGALALPSCRMLSLIGL